MLQRMGPLGMITVKPDFLKCPELLEWFSMGIWHRKVALLIEWCTSALLALLNIKYFLCSLRHLICSSSHSRSNEREVRPTLRRPIVPVSVRPNSRRPIVPVSVRMT